MLRAVREIPFFVPLATLPMQSGAHAASVLADSLDAGFHGAMIGTQPKGASGVLDDPDLDPFWQMASDRHATLFVHPTFGVRDDRLKAYGLVSAIGRLTDTTIAIARLLYSGHLSRYPGVSLVISHGGATLPMALGRMRRSFATNPAKNSDPSDGFGRLYFDSVVYDPTVLRFICDIAGTDKVLMGTDEPFVIAEQEPVRFVRSCELGAKAEAAILGDTAARLFNIAHATAIGQD
jgi:aminocarboxymuconate-semialdehyde decarboxylase